MIAWLIGVSIIMGYLIAGGVVGGLAFAYIDSDAYGNDAECPAFFAGAFWPVVLPVCLGVWIARTPERKRQRVADAERRTRELEKELGLSPPATFPKPRLSDPYRRGGPV